MVLFFFFLSVQHKISLVVNFCVCSEDQFTGFIICAWQIAIKYNLLVMVNVDVLHYLASKGYILLYEKYVALCQNFFFRLWLHAVQRKCIVFLCINFCHEYENILYIHIYFPHILFKFQVFSCTSQS